MPGILKVRHYTLPSTIAGVVSMAQWPTKQPLFAFHKTLKQLKRGTINENQF
jgi:hypothetical protein